MRLLALDAAAGRCSVAVLKDDVLHERSVESGQAHAEDLLALSGTLLAEVGMTLPELDGIASSVGPGAFTGVRVTVSVAQGLAFGAGLKVVAVNTLEALALQLFPAHERAFACLDARMGEVYFGCFARDQILGVRTLSEPRVAAPAALAVPDGIFAGIGQGLGVYPALMESHRLIVPEGAAQALPRAREIAMLGARRLLAGAGMDPKALEPLYVRDKVAYTSAERAGR